MTDIKRMLPTTGADIDKIKRIISGCEPKIKKAIVSIDKEKPEIVIQGSSPEPYVATLEECTCQDFIFRMKRLSPCKHMYCLADELGLLEEYKHLHYDDATYNPKEQLDALDIMFQAGMIKPEYYVKLYDALSKMK